jgi:hypothetical protein
MAFYRVMLNGTGILIPEIDSGKSIVGFYTTRAVMAVSVEKAIERAKALVNSEWLSARYQKTNKGDHPILTVDDVFTEHFFGFLTFHNKGYSFYTDSDEN